MNFKERHERRKLAHELADMFLMGDKDAENAIAFAQKRGIEDLMRKVAKERVIKSIQDDMIQVPGGTFVLGSPTNEDGEDKGYQCHVADFAVSKTDVTEHYFNALHNFPNLERIGSRKPVTEVNWYQCNDFCKRLSKETGKRYTITCEANWEYVCKGGPRTRNCKYSGSNDLNKVSNQDGGSDTKPVACYMPNELGVHDMSSSIWEWCADAYDQNAKANRVKIINGEIANYKTGIAVDYIMLKWGVMHQAPKKQDVVLNTNLFDITAEYNFGVPSQFGKKLKRSLGFSKGVKQDIAYGYNASQKDMFKLASYDVKYYNMV